MKIINTIFILAVIIFLAGCGKNPAESDKFLKSGIENFNKNKLDDAMNDFNTAIKMNNKNAEAYYQRGVLYVAKNDLKSGISDFDDAIDINNSGFINYRWSPSSA